MRAVNLIDEKTWTKWETPWNTPDQLTTVLDLGSSQAIGSIRVYISAATYSRDTSFRVSDSPNGPWTDIDGAVHVDFGALSVWQSLPVSATGRYIQVQITNPGNLGKLGGFGEIEIYRP
jgi:hypothetical protein